MGVPIVQIQDSSQVFIFQGFDEGPPYSVALSGAKKIAAREAINRDQVPCSHPHDDPETADPAHQLNFNSSRILRGVVSNLFSLLYKTRRCHLSLLILGCI